MIPKLFDTHCHVHFPAFDEDRDAVLLRMKQRGVWGITVGTTIKTSKEAISFAETRDDIFATVGYHPEHLTSSFHDECEGMDVEPYRTERIRELAASSSCVVAIGETGLDFFRIDDDRSRHQAQEIQKNALREHIRIADELNLPIILHCRDAFKELAEVVQEEQGKGLRAKGVVHCFTGTWEEAKPLLDLGLHLSFTGIITFPTRKSDNPERSVHRVIERMPLERICIETDAPWLTPIPFRGKRNEPAHVEYIAKEISRILGRSEDEIARVTTENALRLFSRIGG